MKRFLLCCLSAACLALAACNRDQPAADAAVTEATNPASDTAVVIDDDADLTVYQDQANRTADRVATDLALEDTARKRRLRDTYYTRAQRLGDLDAQYETDTTGRAAAASQIDADADTEVRTIVGDDTRYRTYQTNRSRYYGSPAAGSADARSSTVTTTTITERTTRPARRRRPAIVKYENKNGEIKIVYANGKTVKIDKDGDRKTEYANGVKVKRDADDGQVKIKR